MSKKVSVSLVILSTVALFIATALPVLPFDARSGETVTIAKGEVVDGDLYAAGGTIVVEGTVDGDVWAFGRTVTISGGVTGSVLTLGETVAISGDVARSVRAGGKTVDISGDIEGDLIAGGQRVELADGARLVGDLLFGAQEGRIDAPVEGDITGGSSKVRIGSAVGGNVELNVEKLTLSSTADIQGDLTYTSVEEADIQAGAQIAGDITHNLPEVRGKRAKPFPLALLSNVAGRVILFLMALVLGLIIILVAPRRVTSLAESIRTRPGPSIGWGAVILFLTPIAAIIVCFTVVGLPIGVIALLLWGIAIYLSQIPVSLFLGRWITRRRPAAESKGIVFGAFALGLIILRLLRLIPKVGWIFGLVVVLFGLGAIVVTARRPAEARELA